MDAALIGGATPSRKQTILVVDDAELNRGILMDMLGEGYDFIEAENGVEAIAAIKEHGSAISLVLLDVVMPDMDGIEVLEKMGSYGWINDIPVIMITSDTSADTARKAYSLGAADFIGRPFDVSIVRKRVLNALVLRAKQDELANLVQEEVMRRERSVASMVAMLSQIVEFRNGDGAQHVVNVNALTELLLQKVADKTGKYDLSPDAINTIKLASSLHDIGKISIPERILNKPGRLTKEEFEVMKTHSAIGAEILEGIPGRAGDPLIQAARDICRWHHERYDGKGYPDGLSGEEIPISAQVVSLADVYDALTSKRVYKDAYSHEEAMNMIVGGACGQFNPLLIECLEEVADGIPAALAAAVDRESVPDVRTIMSRSMGTSHAPAVIAPSGKTLDLLDYERKKYDFYAQMSNEVQFDYVLDPPVVTIQDHGNRKIGLSEIVHDPLHDAGIIEMFGQDAIDELVSMVKETTPDNPVVQLELLATVDGQPRWFHLDARSMWAEGKDGEELVGVIGKLVDVHESHARLAELEKRATHDSLTDLVNHAFARTLITAQMAEYPDDTFALMVLDMDHFKDANDEHGHLFGDEVLKHLAGKLRDSVRESDVVCRVGGDEFLLCMKVDSVSKPLVDRVYNSLLGEYKGFPISVSMGVEVASGSDMPYDELFERADEALYAMKRNGRGGYMYRSEVSDEDLIDASVRERGEIESNLPDDKRGA